VRPFLIACALFLIGATAALAQPDVRPFEPFLAASPLPQTPLVLRDRPGGTPVATLGAKTEFGSPETVGVAVTQGDWLGVISTKLPNGVLGWVKRTDVQVRPVVWSIGEPTCAPSISGGTSSPVHHWICCRSRASLQSEVHTRSVRARMP